MRYGRKTTRPPRVIEDSAALLEATALRQEVSRLQSRLAAMRVRVEIAEALQVYYSADLGKVATELRQERTKNDFLMGRHGVQCEPWDIRRIFG